MKKREITAGESLQIGKIRKKRGEKAPEPILSVEDQVVANELIEETNKKHSTQVKACVITCIGVNRLSLDTGKMEVVYAEGHRKVRLVAKQDVHQVKRCEACQRMYNLLSRRQGTELLKTLERIVERGEEAEETLTTYGKDLTKEEVDVLKDTVKKGKVAQKMLTKKTK